MNKKFLSSLLFATLVGGAVSTFTACKDYDDDINNLQKQIDANADAIKKINELIQSGSVITNVTKTANGVTVTLSNGKSFDLTNGENGKDGAAWTIGSDDYWYKDGVKTEYLARGPQGEKGDKGDTGATGPQGPQGPAGGNGSTGSDAVVRYYVPNAETQCFDIYEDGVFKEHTTISYIGAGVLTAVLNDDELWLYGVKNSSTEPVVISRSGKLTSLVFMPYYYMDGIEFIDYAWLNDTIMTPVTNVDTKNHQTKNCHFLTPADKDQSVSYYEADAMTGKNLPTGKKINDYNDYRYTDPAKKFVYGPAWSVDYHANPVNSKIAYSDITGYNVLEPATMYTQTRATAAALGVTSPEKDYADNQLFKLADDGVLTAGIQIAHPDKLNSRPTAKVNQQDVNTVALKVKNADGKEVVSDYAMLQSIRAYIDGMVWRKNPTYKASGAAQTGDEMCQYTNTKVQIWDTPQEALKDERGAALELYWDSQEGIDLEDYVGIHIVKEEVKKWNGKDFPYELQKTLSPKEAKKWGLTFHFNKVQYTVDSNITADSKFLVRHKDATSDESGKFRAWNVKWDEAIQNDPSATSVDREPLVQVTVTNVDGDVVLDGYILLHITKQLDDNLTVDWKEKESTFNLCDVTPVFQTTWAEFNDWMLTDALANMTKEEFDYQYEADLEDATTNYGSTAEPVYMMKMFKDPIEVKGETTPETKNASLGHVFYKPNDKGTTNHTWRWEIDEDQMENLLHHDMEKTVIRYVRFRATKNNAKYPYIYVKMTAKIKRSTVNGGKLEGKINEYWFKNDGNDEGFDAIALDVFHPYDGGNIQVISHPIRNTFVNNLEKVTSGLAHKFYFEPKSYTIKAQNGKVYTITPVADTQRAGIGDKLICKYNAANYACGDFNETPSRVTVEHGVPANDTHAYPAAAADLKKTLETCAINYNDGVYNNKNLYAIYNNVATQIAVMDQATGKIDLIHNDVTEDILNAVGYEIEHQKLEEQMRAYIGVVAKNTCDVATFVEDGQFFASWERPINLLPIAGKEVVDANTNGNVIYLLDLIKLFDWRGVWTDELPEFKSNGYNHSDKFAPADKYDQYYDKSKMWGENQWFWAYYNVHAISVDMSEASVLTDMNQAVKGDITKAKKLSDITHKLDFMYMDETGAKSNGIYTFDNFAAALQADYNFKGSNSLLQNYMNANKELFGRLYYANNGDNVTEFNLWVPITIGYEWGKFTQYVQITVKRTSGN